MAKCNICGREMTTACGCVKTPVVHHKKRYNPIKVGDPGDFFCFTKSTLLLFDGFDGKGGRCGDCGAKPGHYHHPGCDCERCPICGGQLISCGCDDRGKLYDYQRVVNSDINSSDSDIIAAAAKNCETIYLLEKYRDEAENPWFRFLRVPGEDGSFSVYQVANVTKTYCELHFVSIYGGRYPAKAACKAANMPNLAQKPVWDYFCRKSRAYIERLLREQDESGYDWSDFKRR